MNWETVFYTAAALAVITIVGFVIALRTVLPADAATIASPITQKDVGEKIPIGRIMIEAGILPVFGCIVVTGFLRDGIESWLPTLYSEAFGRESTESILVSVILPIFSILSVTTITAMHKKPLFNNEIRGSGILFALAIVLCVPLALLISNETVVARVICLVLVAVICAAMHAVNFLLISCVPGRFASYGRSSTVSGLTNACIYIGAAASMYGIAVISEVLGWSATVVSWIIIAAAGIVLAVFAYRKYTKFIVTTG